jgi:ferric-dicitrate binding protein FerR (iron transport regulator)
MKLDTLHKYFNGTASDDERREVLAWVEESPANKEEFQQREADFLFASMPDTEASQTATTHILNVIAPKRRKIRILDAVASAAAVFVVGAFLWVLHDNSRLNSQVASLTAQNEKLIAIPELVQGESVLNYKVNPGVKGRITLPDGSEVILNSASTLRTPARFENGKRVVELEGEGYFKVESNPDWPMYVRTSRGVTVKVTGTEFNLSTYSDDAALKLTLVRGKVSLLDEKNETEVAVREKEEVVIGARAQLEKPTRKTADLKLNTSWKDGYLVFDNTPIREVIKKMERWYGVDITVADARVMNNTFTASFRSESLQQVLTLLDITCGIKSKIKSPTEVELR